MRALKVTTLLLFTAAFDLFVIWAVIFTVPWNDGFPPLSTVGFWVFAASPVVVTAYCVHKLRRFRRGENPPI